MVPHAARVLVSFLIVLAVAAQPLRAELIFVNPGAENTTPGHPARTWTDAEKKVLNQAVEEWKKYIPDFDRLVGRWTLRWEDKRLFKKWTTPSGGGDDFSGEPAVTIRKGDWAKFNFPSPPKDSADYPEGEIYFNTFLSFDLWFFDPTPATDDPGEPPPRTFDFLTVATHELGHALGIRGHLPDNVGAVMEISIGLGERDRISSRDLDFIRRQGGELARSIVPEPSVVLQLLIASVATLLALARRSRALPS